MDVGPAGLRLRPFGEEDFDRLASWVPSEAAMLDWCGGFFRFPLDRAQLAPYLEQARPGGVREIYTACTPAGEAVGHVEVSHIWPHLSSRLSRILVPEAGRRRGLGREMITLAVRHSFESHRVDRIDLGVLAGNAPAIACYRALGFREIGTWPAGMPARDGPRHVLWMTLFRSEAAPKLLGPGSDS